MDDEKYFQRLFQVNLERAGYTVSLASDGQEALNKIVVDRIDLAVLDISMPAPNGFDILEQIRSAPSLSRLRVILKFASSAEFDAARAIVAEADGFFIMPIPPLELVAIIKQLQALLI